MEYESKKTINEAESEDSASQSQHVTYGPIISPNCGPQIEQEKRSVRSGIGNIKRDLSPMIHHLVLVS